ncbi:lipopolysaccharide/colanic/teichoic acid biosynthesis glycosyltransferase [Pedobacter africanus]|uniref:Lipopolysaccharide/colanic/teichoic acid biosynthesis glycosyltransferase n=1 Tax=Pedobacter africanus TaxID=151894 RepID=A0ACC6KTN3_9SPHI|nr:sugar transferase [Pedobacter africanus]MDR6782497.1 lipopolysaccharide/colanic/teichoic acid biosynthesis glycosyltransferase [Pedobacter africanus]
MMITTTMNRPEINAKIVYFGKLLKSEVFEDFDSNFNIEHLEDADDFKRYLDSRSLLSLPDIILLEVDDNKDCFNQVSYIKNNPLLHGLVIVLLGIKENKEWRSKALKLQVNDYYTYPFPVEDFYERLNFLIKFKLIKPKLLELSKQMDVEYQIPLTKRVFDVLTSGFALLFLTPLFILVAILIKLESKGAVIYKSKRVGAGYKIFDFYKFRSMRSDADQMIASIADLNQYSNESNKKNGKAAFVKFKNDPRITKLGSFLRRTSIDELPQLINVFIGDMSLVGNRPLPLYEAEQLTTNEWSTRFLGPAGLTGLWQISKRGKKDMSETERKELDNYYAANYSIFLDLKIIVKTIPALIQKEQV